MHSFTHDDVSYSKHSDRGKQVRKQMQIDRIDHLLAMITLWSLICAVTLPMYAAYVTT